MHIRVLDLAAERCVWSIPPIDTVPFKLRTQKLVVRCVDNDGEVVDVVPVDGLKLQDLAPQLLADRRVARLNIHLALEGPVHPTNKSYHSSPLRGQLQRASNF